jgi:general stress protein YciG
MATKAQMLEENPGYVERRGFAGMSPEKKHEICSKGGRAAHKKGTAHEWNSDTARKAGRKGYAAGIGLRRRNAQSAEEGAVDTPPST